MLLVDNFGNAEDVFGDVESYVGALVERETPDLRHDVALTQHLAHIGSQLVQDLQRTHAVLLTLVMTQLQGQL